MDEFTVKDVRKVCEKLLKEYRELEVPANQIQIIEIAFMTLTTELVLAGCRSRDEPTSL